MSTVEYDLDSSGGIMEQIQKLVAPPVSDEAARRLRRRNRTAENRRHGRAVNHDCCDSCKEGGDLLCCDRCPAAFHLLCHDPPLGENDLPPGEWVCHRCRVTPSEGKDNEDAESTSSSRSSRLKRSAPPDVVVMETEPTPSTSSAGLPPPAPVLVPAKDREAEDKKKETEDKSKEAENCSTPFHMLIKAARIMNPVQFELSKDIACTTPLPGSSKRVYGRSYRAPKKQAHELDGGLVPLPAKVCFTCTKSCRIGPLIQCDFCPLLFHMDCLSPPLTSLPTGRWMCPNHVEHFVDEYMIRSNSLTERVKLWDRYTGLVDQHAVKLNFLKHVHRTHPPFRIKRRLPPRKTVAVPEAVKEHYKNPSGLLPLPQRGVQSQPEPAIERKTTFDATPEEQEEWLSSVVCLQTSIAKHLSQKQLQKSGGSQSDPSRPSDSLGSTGKPTASVAPVVHRESDFSSTASTDGATRVADGAGVSGETGKSGQDSVNGLSEQSALSVSGGCGSSSKPSSAISLLHGNVTSGGAVNGETAEILDLQKAKVEAAVRTRSNSAGDAAGVIKVSWHGSDKTVSQPGTSSSSSTPSGQQQQQQQLPPPGVLHHPLAPPPPPGVVQGKNIVISTINKANNTVVTKVLPSGTAVTSKVLPSGTAVTSKVVLPPGVSARSVVAGASPTSILSPRVLVQPSLQRLGVASSAPGMQGQGTAGTQTKVISVSTSTSGNKTATVVSAPKGVTSSLSSLPAILNLNSALQQWIEGSPDGGGDEVGKLDERLLQLLAWQRLQQLLPPPAPHAASTPNNSAIKKGLLNGLLTPGDSEVKARAVLCPLTGKGQAISMPFRTLSMGTGADMDVPLLQFGHCNFISSKHAVIFYDEMTRHFELLNYSEFGTTVDNVLYSCDFSDKPATTAQPSPVVATVREIIGKTNKDKDHDKSKDKRYIMSARSREPCRACSCKTGSLSLMGGGSGAGWEGTAVLHHGSYIQMGCLQFVFSIVDQASQDLLPPPRIKPPEQMSLLKTHLKAAQ